MFSLGRPEFVLGLLGARASVQLHIALSWFEHRHIRLVATFEVMTCRRTERTLDVATCNVSNGALPRW